MADHKQIEDYDNRDSSTSGAAQRSGQRVVGGPPDGWQGAPPSRGCEVYVTRIPRDCFEPELLPVFTQVGNIYEHRLMMEPNGLNRGYAYVKFTNVKVKTSLNIFSLLILFYSRMQKKL